MNYQLILSLNIFLIAWSTSYGTNVKEFGAIGDGNHDDTEAVLHAISHAEDGVIIFPKGRYRITKTIELLLSKSGPIGIQGRGGSASVIMEGIGPAFRIIGSHSKGTADPGTVSELVWAKERMPTIQTLEIVGKNPNASGIELINTFQAIIKSVLIREAEFGIHIKSRNRNIIIEGCHIYNCSNIGVFLDGVNLHQINISNNHISYNNRSGIKIQNSVIRNIQITGNDIEYNYDQSGRISADLWIDASQAKSSVREGTITGNTIQSISSNEGCNILFVGKERNSNMVGLFSITGNHISNQSTNIYLKSVRGIEISGNSFTRGYERHITVDNCRNISIGLNIFDRNEDYYNETRVAKGGIVILESKDINCLSNIIEGIDNIGAIEIRKSAGVVVSDCQIRNPSQRGIYIDSSNVISINGCVMKTDTKKAKSKIGVFVNKDCEYVNISGNIFDLGSKEAIFLENKSVKLNLINGNINTY